MHKTERFPSVIQNAKMNIDLITKYNNYDLINAKETFNAQASNLFKNGGISEEAFAISTYGSQENNKINKAKSQRTLFHKGLTEVDVDEKIVNRNKKGLTVTGNFGYDDKLLLIKAGVMLNQEEEMNEDTMIKKQFSTGLKINSNIFSSNILGEERKQLTILEERSNYKKEST